MPPNNAQATNDHLHFSPFILLKSGNQWSFSLLLIFITFLHSSVLKVYRNVCRQVFSLYILVSLKRTFLLPGDYLVEEKVNLSKSSGGNKCNPCSSGSPNVGLQTTSWPNSKTPQELLYMSTIWCSLWCGLRALS